MRQKVTPLENEVGEKPPPGCVSIILGIDVEHHPALRALKSVAREEVGLERKATDLVRLAGHVRVPLHPTPEKEELPEEVAIAFGRNGRKRRRMREKTPPSESATLVLRRSCTTRA